MSLQAVVIGASAGGVQALSQVLPALRVDFPLPVLVVVHIPPRRDNALVDLFAGKCRLSVKEAEDKEPLEPGTIYFAPPDYHLLVEAGGTIALSSDERAPGFSRLASRQALLTCPTPHFKSRVITSALGRSLCNLAIV